MRTQAEKAGNLPGEKNWIDFRNLHSDIQMLEDSSA